MAAYTTATPAADDPRSGILKDRFFESLADLAVMPGDSMAAAALIAARASASEARDLDAHPRILFPWSILDANTAIEATAAHLRMGITSPFEPPSIGNPPSLPKGWDTQPRFIFHLPGPLIPIPICDLTMRLCHSMTSTGIFHHPPMVLALWRLTEAQIFAPHADLAAWREDSDFAEEGVKEGLRLITGAAALHMLLFFSAASEVTDVMLPVHLQLAALHNAAGHLLVIDAAEARSRRRSSEQDDLQALLAAASLAGASLAHAQASFPGDRADELADLINKGAEASSLGAISEDLQRLPRFEQRLPKSHCYPHRWATTAERVFAPAGPSRDWLSYSHADWLDPAAHAEVDALAFRGAPELRGMGIGRAVSSRELGATMLPSPALLKAGCATSADVKTSRSAADAGLPTMPASFRAAMIVVSIFTVIAADPDILAALPTQVSALMSCIFADVPAWPAGLGPDLRNLLHGMVFRANFSPAERALRWANAAIQGRWQLPFAAAIRSVSIHYSYHSFSLAMVMRYSQSFSTDWTLNAMAYVRHLCVLRLFGSCTLQAANWPVTFLSAWDEFMTPLLQRWVEEDVGAFDLGGHRALRFWRNAASWYHSEAFVLDAHARLMRSPALSRPAGRPDAPPSDPPKA